jgi:hypothetical protein
MFGRLNLDDEDAQQEGNYRYKQPLHLALHPHCFHAFLSSIYGREKRKASSIMLWSVVAPFFTSDEADDRWLDDLIDDPGARFVKIKARESDQARWHKRSTRATPILQWARYWRQSSRALERGDGVVTVFPQLAMTVAIQRRLRGGRQPIIAWSFNLGRFPSGIKGSLAAMLLRSIDRFVVHSRGEIALLRDWLRIDERRIHFVPLQRAAIPILSTEEQDAPFAVAMGSANRDYATLFEACRRSGLPVSVVAAPHALPPGAPPPNVQLLTDLDPQACLTLAQRARFSVVPLADVAAASGQITIVEAMRMGRPLIATDTIGTRDYLVDGETGLLVPPHNAAQLAAAMERLWHDSDLRAQVGGAARRFAEANLSDEVATAALKRLLDEFA